ncbi:MAG: hypothetical protein GAK29_00042 [Acinetobacter bereziniae]|uniref:Lipoprotein n=1 Tax=Acinetobacter bereziniae TaxID=106648 RepID=A0A833UUG4_ACIBZ|nr:MAG: hypothetical protein GAK29_00042 [Acinetobacter bereziniae]
MNLKAFLWFAGAGCVLQACTSINTSTSDTFKQYASPQEMIDKKNINEINRSFKEYVYDWGPKQGNQSVQSLTPKNYLNHYCTAKGGHLSQVQTSAMNLVKDIWAKKLLNTYSSVKQGIGAYHCFENNGQQWYVSIEPLSEQKLEQSETRVVVLQTKILSLDELKKLYSTKTNATIVQQEKKAKSHPAKSTEIKANNSKNTPVNIAVKTAPIKPIEEKKPVTQIVEELKEKPQTEKVVITPQAQQMQLYSAARKDLGRGQNQINACNNAERAYNYGRLHGTSGINVYAESGILVARCLTNVPSYSQRLSNPQDRAKRILQNLSTNQNHAVAKHMLKQMK